MLTRYGIEISVSFNRIALLSRNHRALFAWTLLCSGIAFLAPAFSQTKPARVKPTISSNEYIQNFWTTANGLPQNSVNAVLQTRDGYLWVATYGGLARFDGVKFTVFDVAEPGGIKSNRILSLCESKDGALWIGTSNAGLMRYKDGIFTSVQIPGGQPEDLVSIIYEDSRGALWMKTSRGLVRFFLGEFKTLTPQDGLPNAIITSLAEDQDKNFWIGTTAGLVRMSGGQLITLTTRDGLPSDSVTSICARRGGGLWVGTHGGLGRIDQGMTIKKLEGPDSNAIGRLFEDRSGNLWISTAAGLDRLTDDSVVHCKMNTELKTPAVACMTDDREGNIWIGTQAAGLCRFRSAQLTVYASERGLANESVVPIIEGAPGEMWIGMTCSGLARLHDGRIAPYPAGLNGCVWALLHDSKGALWVGTWGGGLTRLKDGQSVNYRKANSGLSNDGVLSLFEDRNGIVWIGTGDGLNKLLDGRITSYRTTDGLVGNDVRFITEDHQGAIWVGTTGGVSRIAGGSFTNYTTKEGLSNDYVRAIQPDEDDTIWLGTYGGGLNRLKDGRISQYTIRNGLFDNIISRILEDNSGHFWMSGNKGIFRVSKLELNEFADGKIGSIGCVSYGIEDGMKSSECNGGGQPAGWKSRDGKLWFPTARGIVMIDPDRIATNNLAPPVTIERVLVDRNAVTPLGEVQLRPGQNDLEIDYAGLSLVASENVRFRYRLDGLDASWIDVGTRRAAYYSHVPPGRYSFTVIASNSDGVWNSDGATIRIVVIPPFWRTWWFAPALVLSAIALSLLAYRQRITHLQKARESFSRQLIDSQERERKRIAAELHDSLGQSLLVIKNRALLGTQLSDGNDNARDQFDEITTSAAEAIEEVREIAYDLRPYHLDRLGLTSTLEAMIERIAGASSIRFTADIPHLDGLFSPESEISLYRIVQECVNNIVKHSEATEASIKIQRDQQSVHIKITDNGKGFAQEPPAAGKQRRRGFGLTGIAERVRLLGGSHSIHSSAGEGTTIRIKIALETMETVEQ
jgi:signal transduction histidine kinase/ligand-binding sensor domain-containing protein